MNKKVIFFILVYFLNIFTIFGDTRTRNIDVYLVLDKSLSMVEEIDSVKDYVSEKIIREILIPGDRFTLILFYGKAVVAYSGTVGSGGGKDLLLKKVASIKADGHFTDIGNALDMLKKVLAESEPSSRMKYLLLITDGKQEAPPESKYYSPDHTFNHEFLKNVKVIQKEGWKIEILGIGVESAARELAEKLSGTYREVPPDATSEEIAEAVGNLTGVVTVDNGKCTLKKVKKNGSALLEFSLSSSGYKDPVSIEVAKIIFDFPYGKGINILKSPFKVTVPPGGSTRVETEVELPAGKGPYDGEISFVFGSGESFSPGLMEISVPAVVNYLILLYILIAVSVAAAVFILVRSRKGKSDDEDNKKRDRTIP